MNINSITDKNIRRIFNLSNRLGYKSDNRVDGNYLNSDINITMHNFYEEFYYGRGFKVPFRSKCDRDKCLEFLKHYHYKVDDIFFLILDMIKEEKKQCEAIDMIKMLGDPSDITENMFKRVLSGIKPEIEENIISEIRKKLNRICFNESGTSYDVATILLTQYFQKEYFSYARNYSKEEWSNNLKNLDLEYIIKDLNKSRASYYHMLDSGLSTEYNKSKLLIDLLKRVELIMTKFNGYEKRYNDLKEEVIESQKKLYLDIYKNREVLSNSENLYSIIMEHLVNNMGYGEWILKEIINNIESFDGINKKDFKFFLKDIFYNYFTSPRRYKKEEGYNLLLDIIFGDEAEVIKLQILESKERSVIDDYYEFEIYSPSYLKGIINKLNINKDNISNLVRIFSKIDIKLLLDNIDDTLVTDCVLAIINNKLYNDEIDMATILRFIIDNKDKISIEIDKIRNYAYKCVEQCISRSCCYTIEQFIEVYSLSYQYLNMEDNYNLLLDFSLKDKRYKNVTNEICNTLIEEIIKLTIPNKDIQKSLYSEIRFETSEKAISKEMAQYRWIKTNLYKDEYVEIYSIYKLGILVKPLKQLEERPGYYYINVTDNGEDKVYKVCAKDVTLEELIENYLIQYDSTYVHDWCLRGDCIDFANKKEYELLGEETNDIKLVYNDSLNEQEKEKLYNEIISEKETLREMVEKVKANKVKVNK